MDGEEEDAILGLTLTMPSEVDDTATGGDNVDGRNEAFEAAMEAMRREADGAGGGGDGGATSDDNEGSDNDDDGAAETGAARGGDGFSDEQLLAISKKKQARKLGKAAYKRWKKLQKKSGDGADGGKSKKKSKKGGDDKKKKKPKKKAEKRARADDAEAGDFADAFVGDRLDDAFGLTENDFLAATQAATTRGRRLDNGVQRVQRVQPARRGPTAEERFHRAQETATNLVKEMRTAQARDEQALLQRSPPLHRIAIKDKVQAICTRQSLIGLLVDAGLLGELSKWLYDLQRGEPAPYELRCIALDILLRIPTEGEVMAARGGDDDDDGDGRRKGRAVGEDLTKFAGLTRDDLSPTDLGRAVNALRLHQQETSSNRSKCVRLLERLSNAYSGRMSSSSLTSGGGGGRGVVSWKCKSDPTVRSPFDVVQTGSQSFQQAFMKPDPQDPTSYNNLLQWRPPVRSITNLSGNIGKK